MTAGDGAVHMERRGTAAFITFDRPAARNAMTMGMYDRLANHLEEVAKASGELRAVVLRGSSGTFVAGTDIAHFTGFTSADDGIAYEERVEAVVGRLESLTVPTLAVVEGAAVGAGLMLASVCDLRVCTPDARFGMPIARTVGHGLSVANHARLVAHLGPGRTTALVLLGGFLDAGEARSAGFVHAVLDPGDLEDGVAQLCQRLESHAPLTVRTTKEAVRRVLERGRPEEDDHLLRPVYGSRDFRQGVRAFLDREVPEWEGR